MNSRIMRSIRPISIYKLSLNDAEQPLLYHNCQVIIDKFFIYQNLLYSSSLEIHRKDEVSLIQYIVTAIRELYLMSWVWKGCDKSFMKLNFIVRTISKDVNLYKNASTLEFTFQEFITNYL